MIRFLLQRPIAVLMVFSGLLIIGAITFFTLPVSLLPDIPIPEITVQVKAAHTAARELENTVVKPIRRQLMQVGHLRHISSETRDETGMIRLKFDYGTNTDLAFIEVNEQIDAAMSRLPHNVARPQAIKASATDIPVFYLNISLKNELAYGRTSEEDFLDLSRFVDHIVKRRIEQLPEVAMADMTGALYRYLRITPDMSYMETAHITLSDIEKALAAYNVEPGSMLIRDGYYEYNIKFSSVLRTREDVENMYFQKEDRLLQLKDFAQVAIVKQPEEGLSVVNGKRAITLGIIKQADEPMQRLKTALNKTLQQLQKAYPEVVFTVNRNQVALLENTIAQLKENLSWGFLLVFIVALIFLGDVKSPLIIGMSVLSALIISFVFFYLFGRSLNIIALSGMILALGMMIDSAIIVTDVITQYREQGYTLTEACIKGTNEVMSPVLSSVFTTIAVFLPLVFLSGIAGAIFFDQAFAVSVGLLVSYATGIILLPVLYHLFYRKTSRGEKSVGWVRAPKGVEVWLLAWYERGFRTVFNHKVFFLILLALGLPLCFLLFRAAPKTRMPDLTHLETEVWITWNEPIHIDENKRRVDTLLQAVAAKTMEHSAYIGRPQYLISKDKALSVSEALLYVRTGASDTLQALQQALRQRVLKAYPLALVRFTAPENVFEKIFDTDEPTLVSELYRRSGEEPSASEVRQLQADLERVTGEHAEGIAFEQQWFITVDKERLLRYGVDYGQVVRQLKTAFKANTIATLRSYEQYLPIALAGQERSVHEVLREVLVEGHTKTEAEKVQIPLQSLLHMRRSEGMKTIVAGKNGVYLPFVYPEVKDPGALIRHTRQFIAKNQSWEVQFSGSFFSGKKMLGELLVVLAVSVLLMYLILAAQFESFMQPLIVLSELPIDIAFALLLLRATGHTLNLMSAIGIVAACGIIINDSILKIDSINRLRREGMALTEAIHRAGQKRLRAIVMTSLTTILAMAPLLFSSDMGSELQKPLAVAMIGTMLMGTWVSLYMIPLVYRRIYGGRK